jgi:GNAT superfamily N-acetyltransferase
MTAIRVASEDDVPAAAALLAEFRDWMGRGDPATAALERGVRRLLSDPDTEFLLGSRRDGDPPEGLCQLRYRYGVWHEADDCWLEDLYVRGGARGGGLGAALVEAAIERARARGCARIELDVNEGNSAALRLYERTGFTLSPKPPGRSLLMRRSLA